MASSVQTPLSSLNRRLRNICEREGMDYGEDVLDEDELVRRFRVATQMTAKTIRGVMSEIKRAKTVDLCFLIDGTSSMRPHIEGVRDSVAKIVNTMVRSRAAPTGIEQLRLAVVVYRDFDNPTPMEVCQFTESPDKCVDFCKNAKAISGAKHDPPEDVFGGLEQASKLQWSKDAGTRIVFHMGDSPCHGNRYHSASMRDSYPNGDPRGRTSQDLFKRFKELGIDYYFGKISRHTDQMIDEFCKDYGRFITTFSVEDVSKIAGSVISSISTSVEENVEKSKLGISRQAKLRDYRLDGGTPAWDSLPVLQGTYLVYELPDTVEDVVDDKPLVEKQISNVRVKIAPNPFAEGSERIAYFGQDLFVGYGDHRARSATRRGGRAVSAPRRTVVVAEPTPAATPTDIVLKEYKYLGKKQNTLERYKTACEAQTVAFYLADQFNSLTGPLGEPPIKFLKTKALLLTSSKGLRIMSCERKFFGDVKFVKFSNNCAYSMQSAAREVSTSGVDPRIVGTVMAFSHWTFQRTDGFLMVVDLQGCICEDGTITTSLQKSNDAKAAAVKKTKTKKVLMTDPAIHCLDVTRYAPLNLGRSGMQAFFNGHQCGQLCRRLGLEEVTQPSEKKYMDSMWIFHMKSICAFVSVHPCGIEIWIPHGRSTWK
ncbi:hypothetical protein BOX15_Mlig000706g2 [Macrostomum lignano]|uniref:Alpha-type protein kinase domain-containing protein n=2 Tax=Macrostomum lignano TaxID=282301 RepID=A0A267F7V2_9PLAT|nr:hypothetical protein BOX15_Mlig000706g2 [Macrostomum lignano]